MHADVSAGSGNRRSVARPDPPVVSRDDVAKLRARGLRVVDNAAQVGERKEVFSWPASTSYFTVSAGSILRTPPAWM